MDTILRRQMWGELLKYACGRAISCPTCGGILDCRDAIAIETAGRWGVNCARCLESALRRRAERPDADLGRLRTNIRTLADRGDLLDGRALFDHEGEPLLGEPRDAYPLLACLIPQVPVPAPDDLQALIGVGGMATLDAVGSWMAGESIAPALLEECKRELQYEAGPRAEAARRALEAIGN